MHGGVTGKAGDSLPMSIGVSRFQIIEWLDYTGAVFDGLRTPIKTRSASDSQVRNRDHPRSGAGGWFFSNDIPSFRGLGRGNSACHRRLGRQSTAPRTKG